MTMRHVIWPWITALLWAIAGVPTLSAAEETSVIEDEPYPVVDRNGIPEGFMLTAGDILVPVGTVAGTFQTNLWPNGVVSFRFSTTGDDAVSSTNQVRMLNAMGDWEGVASVDFRQCSPCSGDFIHIRDSSNDDTPANNSAVGRTGGQQVINITSWGQRFIIAHELGHALGFWHEQQRPDRDASVRINCDNIDSEFSCTVFDPNFSFQGIGYGLYDFDSVMHYGECTFSACDGCPNSTAPGCADGGRTIVVLPPNDVQWQTVIGQRTHLSQWDALVMSFLYPQNNWCFLDDQCGNRGNICIDLLFACIQDGDFLCPYVLDLQTAVDNTPTGGTLWILSNGTNYSTGGKLDKQITIRAPLGATLTK